MILSFDKFERYELPQVTLCNPNSRATEVDGKITITDTVGVLSNPKGMNLKLNFNAPHELSFDYYRHKDSDPARVPIEYIVEILDKNNKVVKQVDTFPSHEKAEKCVDEFDLSTLKDGEYLNIIKQSFYDSIYEAIQTDRYIYLTDIGYFIISSVTDSDEDNIDKKSITCKSCEENEFAVAEGLNLDEKTYYLHTENNDGLLDLFLPKTVGWTIGYIDPALLTKPYFVEKTEVDNGYNFLYTTIQDMFECIVEPDIVRRTVSVYSREYYAEHHLTDIHIAKYNLLKHKTVEENDEDKYTALNVQGKDENLEIRAVNPTGKNVIYNFEPRYSWMSPDLQIAIEKWQEKCESVEEEYFNLQKSYYDELDLLFDEEQDVEVKKGELKQLEETRDAALTMTAGDERNQSVKNCNEAITAKQGEINTATSTYNTHKQTINTTYEIPITQINSDCALDITAKDINGNTIFTVELLNELMTHIKPTEYVDEYMLVTESMTYPEKFEKAKELMNRAQSQLIKISSGQKTYSIDTRSFLFNKQFKHFSEQLCAGAIIYVETKSDTMEQLHLTGIDINFDEKSTNFTLGNKYDRSDLKALYEDALGQNSKSFNELKYIAGIVEDQKKYVQKDWAAELRTLTLDNVLTSEDQAIEINNRGLIGRKRQVNEDGSWKADENGNPLFFPEQVKLINNTLVFTDDNWQTAATAVGKIAVGHNADGSVKYSYGINGQVLIGKLIAGNTLTIVNSETDPTIKIDTEGITILKDDKKIFYADENGNLNLEGTITAIGGKIANWYIDKDYPSTLYSKNSNGYTILKSNGYVAFAAGVPINNLPNETTGANFQIYHDGRICAGYDSANKTYNFAVDTTGNVNMTGKITALSGQFGGWNIKGTYIYGGGQNNSPYTVLKSSGSVAFAAGVPSDWKPDGDVDAGETATTGAKVQIWHNGDVRMGLGVNSGGTDANYSFVVDGDTGNISIKNSMLTADSPKLTGTPVFSGSPRFDGRIFASTKSGYDDAVCYMALYSPKYHSSYSTENNAMLIQTRNSTSDTWKTEFVLRYDGKVTANGGISTTKLSITGSALPNSDGSSNLGNSNHRWAQLYAKTATINTSDRNTKENIAELTDVHKQLFMKLIPVSFTFVDGTSGRTHIGFISQDVENAMTELGMTSLDFAGFCKDIKTKIEIDKEGKEIEVPELDENGNEQYLYALRYEEFIGLVSYVLQDTVGRLDKIEERLAKLETF